jgi:hypothetical protein
MFNNKSKIYNETILDYLDRKLKERYTEVEGLPFDFNLGYAGGAFGNFYAARIRS